MRSQNEVLLEHRIAELELVVHRLERQLERLSTPAQSAPAQQAKGSLHPAQRTTIHEKRSYDFFAKLPPIRRVIDYRATNTATGETVHSKNFSVLQLENACQKFARLQFITRRQWTGNKALYSIARKLFAQCGAIVKHPGTVKWVWAVWPHERPAYAAHIVAALSRKNGSEKVSRGRDA